MLTNRALHFTDIGRRYVLLVITWMDDHQGRPVVLWLVPLVGVDLNLRPIVYIAVIVLTRKQNESNLVVRYGGPIIHPLYLAPRNPFCIDVESIVDSYRRPTLCFSACNNMRWAIFMVMYGGDSTPGDQGQRPTVQTGPPVVPSSDCKDVEGRMKGEIARASVTWVWSRWLPQKIFLEPPLVVH